MSNLFWCLHPDCLTSLDYFLTQNELNQHYDSEHSESDSEHVESDSELYDSDSELGELDCEPGELDSELCKSDSEPGESDSKPELIEDDDINDKMNCSKDYGDKLDGIICGIEMLNVD